MKKNNLPYHQNPGFKIPTNYFEDLEHRLIKATASEEEVLSNLRKEKAGFVVPENYFEDLEEKVLQKVEPPTLRKGKGKIISLISRETLYYVAAVAAIFIFIVSTIDLNPKAEQEYNMNNVELSALEEYINNGYLDFNFIEISSFLSEEGYVLEDLNNAQFSDEEVLNYLSENVEDPNLLLE